MSEPIRQNEKNIVQSNKILSPTAETFGILITIKRLNIQNFQSKLLVFLIFLFAD
jgi:hypothetical protein